MPPPPPQKKGKLEIPPHFELIFLFAKMTSFLKTRLFKLTKKYDVT